MYNNNAAPALSNKKKYSVDKFIGWVNDSRLASESWRAESWRDLEMYDGQQWTAAEARKAVDSGVTPITINRTFPVVNLILGSQSVSDTDIIAKARTADDGQASQTMSESIKFVMDQNSAGAVVRTAFGEAVTGGFGCAQVGINSDPREEKISLNNRPWGNVNWDPFGTPWFDPNTCRYVYQDKWMDMADLIAMYPAQAKEIQGQFNELTTEADSITSVGSAETDPATLIEEKRGELVAGQWTDYRRKRVRPVEMWYHRFSPTLFAQLPDGRAIELPESMEPQIAHQIIQQAQAVTKATVRKMYVIAFFGKVVLTHEKSPHAHDKFPFAPFVGYLDRYGLPFGVPRQIRGQDLEVNKRRSLALALMNSRRIIQEEGASADPQATFEESNRLDGHVVLNNGQMGNFRIEELQGLAAPQMQLLQHSEMEIQEVSGANNEMMGYQSNVTSGVGLQQKQEQGSKTTASLMANRSRSLKIMGELIQAGIQQHWTGPKVLRVTDSITGAERFVELNKPEVMPSGETVYHNNISQGRYDIVVSEAPKADTVRERNLSMLIEWVKRAPEQMIPHLMGVAMELSDLPNKESLLAKLKPMLGGMPGEEDMSPEEIKQNVQQQLEAAQEEQAKESQIKEIATQLELQGKQLDNNKTDAETKKILADAATNQQNASTNKDKVKLDAFEVGYKAKKDAAQVQAAAYEGSMKANFEQPRD